MTPFPQIRGIDMRGGICFHALRVEPDLWLWTRKDQPGMIFNDREHLITVLAGLITEKVKVSENTEPVIMLPYCQRLESSLAPGISAVIDPAGNIWHDRHYLPPHKYLPLLVPEEETKPDDND